MNVSAEDRAYAAWICETKIPFNNIKEARAGAVASLAKTPGVKALYWYRCAHCGRLHLTKKRYAPNILAIAKGEHE